MEVAPPPGDASDYVVGSTVCFSPEVDVLAGVFVGAVAVDSFRHVRRPAELLLAGLPAVFAVHQLVESVVWWGLEGRFSESVWRPAVWVYLVIAFAVVPVLAPLAVSALEPVTRRGRMSSFVALSAVVAAILMVAVVRGPVEATIEGHHIAYQVDLWRGGTLVVLYVVATCGAMLASEHDHVRWYGAANLVAVVLIGWIDQHAFVSLWCVWAAVTSVAIALHLRHAERTGSPTKHLTPAG